MGAFLNSPPPALPPVTAYQFVIRYDRLVPLHCRAAELLSGYSLTHAWRYGNVSVDIRHAQHHRERDKDGVRVQLTLLCPSSRSGGDSVELRTGFSLERAMVEDHIRSRFERELQTFVIHEFKESLLLDGVFAMPPHPEDASGR